MEWVIVGSLALLNVIVTVWVGLRLYALIQTGLENLDGSIAAAIKSLVEQGIGDFEPINPVQAAIAQMLTRTPEHAAPVIKEVLRGEDGKFAEKP